MPGWRLVIGVFLVLNGLAHLLGLVPALAVEREWWNLHSWLLSAPLGDPAARVLAVLLWLSATVAFVLAGLVLLGREPRRARFVAPALAAACLSLVAVGLFWDGLVTLVPHKVGAIVVDAALLFFVVVRRWPSPEALAA